MKTKQIRKSIVLLLPLIMGYLFLDMELMWYVVAAVVGTLFLFLPLTVVSDLFTFKLSPIPRSITSLIIHVTFPICGFFFLNFMGAVIQELASNEILPETLSNIKIAIIPLLIYWLLDEIMRWFLREPSAVIQRKTKQSI